MMVGPTRAFAKEDMIEGDGVLSVCPEHNMPTYNKTSLLLKWPSGGMARGFGADKPDRIRGKNLTGAWLDEYCAWRRKRRKDSLTQIRLCLRKGNPKILMTTTPKSDPDYEEIIERALLEPEKYRITYGDSFENFGNLSEGFQGMISDLVGTPEGDQEIRGQLVKNVEGALFKLEWLGQWREKHEPNYTKTVLSLDPSDSDTENSNTFGMGVVATDGRSVFLRGDYTERMGPAVWPMRAIHLAQDCQAILVETQHGDGAIVSLRLAAQSDQAKAIYGPHGAPLPPIIPVSAAKNKVERATTARTLAASGRVFLVGYWPSFTRSLTRWVPGSTDDSPGDLDMFSQAVNHFFPRQATQRLYYGR